MMWLLTETGNTGTAQGLRNEDQEGHEKYTSRSPFSVKIISKGFYLHESKNLDLEWTTA